MIGLFREKNGGNNPPFAKMRDSLTKSEKDKLVRYLKNAECIAAMPAIFRDAFTGEIITGDTVILSDGEYEWFSDIPYYVEKYDMKLDEEFVKKALST